ncbi:hypothetical protein F9802_15795 [Bacillus aerolatus]|uniref:YtkA-like domain-containing protein n=1 Tax=Bacillus aerolatus TaxID=2653354 RepID=A0A6I1FCU4_9BACI|nr:FixH family protein [Bacillus aerolatus]KAB7705021.1 hypothetical protein F9802_15795 [Bacillus aerolatus]
MKKLAILFFSLLVILVGCSNGKKEEKPAETNKAPEMLNVEIQLPDQAEPNEKVTLSAKVTQGEEKVEDASEVQFEIRKKREDNGRMVNGKYTLAHTFISPDTYNVKVHVEKGELHEHQQESVEIK